MEGSNVGTAKNARFHSCIRRYTIGAVIFILTISPRRRGRGRISRDLHRRHHMNRVIPYFWFRVADASTFVAYRMGKCEESKCTE